MEKTEKRELTMEEQVLQAFEKSSIYTSPRWQESLTLTKFAEIITNSELYKDMSEVERATRLMVVGYCMISLFDNAYEKMTMSDGMAIVAKIINKAESDENESPKTKKKS